MKILGIRTAPAQLRYALVVIDDKKSISLINDDRENLIKVPASITNDCDKLIWQKREVDRIIRQNSDIKKVVLKIGEYGQSDTKPKRFCAYLDAMVILAAKEANLPIEYKIYNQLGSKRAQVKEHAENQVGKTTSHWNEQIADAIIAACSAINNV